MFDDDLSEAATALIHAVDEVARSMPAFDEVEHMGAFNDSIEEICAADAEGGWPLLVALLRAWPPELFGQLLERVAADSALAEALERIDEDSASQELSSLAATPEVLMERFG